MPSIQDMISVVRGATPKHLPVFYNFAPCYRSAVGGIPDMTHFYIDTEEKIRLQRRMIELLPNALVFPGIFPDFGVVAEVSAFGGRIEWDRNQAPYCHPCMQDLKEIDTLRMPRPGKTGLTALLIAQKVAMQGRLKETGETLDRFTLTMGPAEVAGLLLGYERYFMGLMEDPKRISKLMEMTTEYIIDWIRVQGEMTGGNDVVMVADHICTQVNPQHFEEMILPYFKEVFRSVPDALKIYHNEGRHSARHVELVLQMGSDVWHYGSDVHPVKELLEIVQDSIVLFGGLNPHGPLRTGAPKEVHAAAAEVASAARGRRMLLSSGTGTTPDASLENVRAMIAGYMSVDGGSAQEAGVRSTRPEVAR